MADDADSARSGVIAPADGASGTWDWDILNNVLYVDVRFAELYGLDPEEARAGLPTSAFYRAIHPEDRARMRIAVAGMLGGAEIFSKEFRVQAADGSLLWMHGRGRAQHDVYETPVRFTGLLVDVTERKRTEERLRVAQSAGGIGTFEFVDGFATAAVSTEFCQLLGLHPAPALPVRTINNVVADSFGPLIPQPGDGGIPETLDGDFCIERGDDGAHRWIARRGEVIREGSGYRLIGVIYDVTAARDQETRLRELNDTLELRVEQEVAERRLTEDALRQAQKMEAVGQLTGGIAHDFNNLLTVIIGNVDTVLRRFDTTADPRARRSLENALKGAERAASLTQRLLAFSRQQPLDPKIIDVARLLTGMSDLLTRSITEAVAIRIHAAPGLWAIEADPNQLENALLNLSVNARDAMGEGGTLTIEAHNLDAAQAAQIKGLPANDYVMIAVRDTGSGMSEETMAKVFDPFFTTKEVGKGTGLGLSMVYGFVKQSGGHVEIDSQVGKGTSVRLFLERAAPVDHGETEGQSAGAQMAQASETVMVVEDDDDVRAYTVGTLRELGYKVIEAHDGVTALKLLERRGRDVQLLLTDVVMPRMSGRELADIATALNADLRVLFTSGYTRDAIVRDGRLEAGVDLLPKPFTYATLAARVRELLDRETA
jgi:PAS domain S-box-containing protein